jgi:hypothetical protein
MDQEEKWLKEATNSLKVLLRSNDITELDRSIFGNQIDNVIGGKSVAFSECEDIAFKRIRSNRLKLFGYTWQAESKTWIKNLRDGSGTINGG